jgi:hypothetical protein
VTFDALHTNGARIEKVVVTKRADCLLQVKDNTPALVEALERALADGGSLLRSAEQFDYGHGRIETRSLEMVPVSPLQTAWPHTHVACRVKRHVERLRRGQVVNCSDETALYVATFPFEAYTPARVLRFIRDHWNIENQLHHPKDRSLDEDRCRASEAGIGRVISCIRGLVTQVSRRTAESMRKISRRLANRQHLLLKLLSSTHLADWERCCAPYKPA